MCRLGGGEGAAYGALEGVVLAGATRTPATTPDQT